MVYENVPEHEGLNDGEVSEKAPRPISTDGWLERISDQLQVFVDAINAAREDDGTPSDDGAGDTPPAEPEKPATPAKKAASKTTEVKGD